MKIFLTILGLLLACSLTWAADFGATITLNDTDTLAIQQATGLDNAAINQKLANIIRQWIRDNLDNYSQGVIENAVVFYKQADKATQKKIEDAITVIINEKK